MSKGYHKIDALTPLSKKDRVGYSKKCVFDIETIKWTEPYAVGFYDDRYRYVLHEGKDCIKGFLKTFLSRQYRGYLCYAHNGGKFDFSFILKELYQEKYQDRYIIELMRAASRIIQIAIKSYRIKKDKDGNEKKEINHVWTLRDSMALFPFSLRDVAKSFGVTHQKGEFDHTKINWRNWQKLKPEWSPYLLDDCRSLYESVTKFEHYIISHFSVNLKDNITLAQLALCVWRSNYQEDTLPCYRAIEDDIREAYFGGRTEIFKSRGQNLKYYDVTSEYPKVMRDRYMPIGKPVKDANMTIDDFGVCKVTVKAPGDIDIPLLPYKNKEGKLLFPRGKWTGFYCTPELQKARELGYEIKVHFGYRFKKKKIFTGYINEMFAMKNSSEKGSVGYMVAKLLMNSLYGKFGQRRERQQIVIFPETTVGYEPVDFFGDLPIYAKKTISRAKHILPAIAAFVTSEARVFLYENCFEQAKAKGGEVFYCDTDSIITNVELETGDQLGDLTDELPQGIEEGIFLLPKMYGLRTTSGEYIKCKGFPRKLFTFEQYKIAVEKGDYSSFTFNKHQIATPFESARRNKTFVSMIDKTRSVQQRYDKRIFINDIDTIPYTINEEIIA